MGSSPNFDNAIDGPEFESPAISAALPIDITLSLYNSTAGISLPLLVNFSLLS